MEETNYIPVILGIFNDFFGEENVDLQEDSEDTFIIIHFPKVTVTNEFDKSIDITELWVKVKIISDGTLAGTFSMLRSEYTLEQFTCGYLHSHVPAVTTDNFNVWKYPCLGHGPLRQTTSNLNARFSEELWNLFCYELSKYITVESSEGGPYIRLERVGLITDKIINFPIRVTNNSIGAFHHLTAINRDILNKFIPYIISKRPFSFNYCNHYDIAASNYKTTIILSNLFIEWYNSLAKKERIDISSLFLYGIIQKVKLVNNNLYDASTPVIPNPNNLELDEIEGILVLKFKGEYIPLKIIKPKIKIGNNEFIILTQDIIEEIMSRILQLINFKYRREHEFTNREKLGFI